MLPTLVFEPPAQGEWIYEIKYDGFRGILDWREDGFFLWSRNGKDLLPKFPELIKFLKENQEKVASWLPLTLDGEIVILENNYKANFQQIQVRGRLKSREKIIASALERPCRFLAFDLLSVRGETVTQLRFKDRKKSLRAFCQELGFPLSPSLNIELIQYVPYELKYKVIEKNMKDFNSEGIVAKQASSVWQEGKRTTSWVKIKNWKIVSCFITGYDEDNGLYRVGVYKDGDILSLGNFINGLDPNTKQALRTAVLNNSTQKIKAFHSIHPAICLDLYYLEWNADQFREPFFKCLRLDLSPENCTYEIFLISDAAFPSVVEISHPNKTLWNQNDVKKIDFLRYIRKVSCFMLPFLENRLLTVIRAPHGEFGEFFYQKNKPNSAPEFIQSMVHDENDMIICNDVTTLIWLGNQLAIEYHIPFHITNSQYVSEIVFDLDPPSRDHFSLAIHAVKIIKKVLDSFSLIGFVKFSGNKGMQVYIPLPENKFTWKDTRVFTEFLANFLVNYDPASFTIERLKKNRHGKLYVDFLQHAEGKTIISPYSPRLKSQGLAASPLYWEEITDNLNPDEFTMKHVLERVNLLGDPFNQYFNSKKKQPFQKILNMLLEGDNSLF
ncbi:DNA ligase D [Bacillus niameyensis]|uniref:DNA ligase D n=1 Tax=Bacillus niameyensis TaxID=1522308 RepID=UPI001E55A452|nr:DNA ligase D [Bacillus niameyensis]